MSEYAGLEQKGLRITVDIDPTDLFTPATDFTTEDAALLTGAITTAVAERLPDGWIATAKVRAKL